MGFKFKDKVVNKEYNLPNTIKTVEGEEIDLRVFLGHIISWGKKHRYSERKSEVRILPDLEVK